MRIPDEIRATLVDQVLVEGCSQMLGEQLCLQSFRLFVNRTGLQDNFTWVAKGPFLHLNRRRLFAPWL
ncbi:hypothetical protein QQF64_006349 [Cirrhinus molitorella]|uniref:Uncharacterized protein n=1 Tax=Cirrhinus molitorella TaxID=172907 RepID=A0ABR3MF82_9TELE